MSFADLPDAMDMADAADAFSPVEGAQLLRDLRLRWDPCQVLDDDADADFDWEPFTALLTFHRVDDGVVIDKGSQAHALYFILEGVVRVMVDDVSIAEVPAGTVLGAQGLFETVREKPNKLVAHEITTFARLDYLQLRAFAGMYPESYGKLVNILATHAVEGFKKNIKDRTRHGLPIVEDRPKGMAALGFAVAAVAMRKNNRKLIDAANSMANSANANFAAAAAAAAAGSAGAGGAAGGVDVGARSDAVKHAIGDCVGPASALEAPKRTKMQSKVAENIHNTHALARARDNDKVSKAQYDELSAKHSVLLATVNGTMQINGSLRAELQQTREARDKLRTENDRVHADKRGVQAQVTALKQQIERLRAEAAEMSTALAQESTVAASLRLQLSMGDARSQEDLDAVTQQMLRDTMEWRVKAQQLESELLAARAAAEEDAAAARAVIEARTAELAVMARRYFTLQRASQGAIAAWQTQCDDHARAAAEARADADATRKARRAVQSAKEDADELVRRLEAALEARGAELEEARVSGHRARAQRARVERQMDLVAKRVGVQLVVMFGKVYLAKRRVAAVAAALCTLLDALGPALRVGEAELATARLRLGQDKLQQQQQQQGQQKQAPGGGLGGRGGPPALMLPGGGGGGAGALPLSALLDEPGPGLRVYDARECALVRERLRAVRENRRLVFKSDADGADIAAGFHPHSTASAAGGKGDAGGGKDKDKEHKDGGKDPEEHDYTDPLPTLLQVVRDVSDGVSMAGLGLARLLAVRDADRSLFSHAVDGLLGPGERGHLAGGHNAYAAAVRSIQDNRELQVQVRRLGEDNTLLRSHLTAITRGYYAGGAAPPAGAGAVALIEDVLARQQQAAAAAAAAAGDAPGGAALAGGAAAAVGAAAMGASAGAAAMGAATAPLLTASSLFVTPAAAASASGSGPGLGLGLSRPRTAAGSGGGFGGGGGVSGGGGAGDLAPAHDAAVSSLTLLRPPSLHSSNNGGGSGNHNHDGQSARYYSNNNSYVDGDSSRAPGNSGPGGGAGSGGHGGAGGGAWVRHAGASFAPVPGHGHNHAHAHAHGRGTRERDRDREFGMTGAPAHAQWSGMPAQARGNSAALSAQQGGARRPQTAGAGLSSMTQSRAQGGPGSATSVGAAGGDGGLGNYYMQAPRVHSHPAQHHHQQQQPQQQQQGRGGGALPGAVLISAPHAAAGPAGNGYGGAGAGGRGAGTRGSMGGKGVGSGTMTMPSSGSGGGAGGSTGGLAGAQFVQEQILQQKHQARARGLAGYAYPAARAGPPLTVDEALRRVPNYSMG